ncbi:hypothetical protein JCM5353_000353 [Sporobolomyces roseus]
MPTTRPRSNSSHAAFPHSTDSPDSSDTSIPLVQEDSVLATRQWNRERIKDLQRPNGHQRVTLPITYARLVETAAGSKPLSREASDRAGLTITPSQSGSTVLETQDGVPILYLWRNQLREVPAGSEATKMTRGGQKAKKQKANQVVGDAKQSRRAGEQTKLSETGKPRVYADKTPFHRRIAQQIYEYATSFKATRKLSVNARHSKTFTRDIVGIKKDYSVRYFGLWQALGHEGEGKTTYLAPDMVGGSKKGTCLREVMGLFAQLVLFWELVYLMMDVLEPRARKIYQAAFDRERPKNPFAGFYHSSKILLFCTVALIVNARVSPHRDKRDSPHGFAAMTVFGEFEGGDLYLPRFNIRLRYSPGDIVLSKSALLEHAILPFEGNRYALVGFTHHRLLQCSKEGHIDSFLRDFRNWDSREGSTSSTTATVCHSEVSTRTMPTRSTSATGNDDGVNEVPSSIKEAQDWHTVERFGECGS